MTGTRIVVTGSRDFSDLDLVTKVLDKVLEKAPHPVVIVHGAAKGVDQHAAAWAILRGLPDPIAYPAHWNELNKRAGFARNREMLRSHPDLVLGFHRVCRKETCRRRELHGTHGTEHCLNLADKLGLNWRVWKEGW